MSSTDLSSSDALEVTELALEYARNIEAGVVEPNEVSTLVCHLVTLSEDLPRLLAVADTLADRLRSANAVIERMKAAQFNPAILDRICEALEEHRDVCGIR